MVDHDAGTQIALSIASDEELASHSEYKQQERKRTMDTSRKLRLNLAVCVLCVAAVTLPRAGFGSDRNLGAFPAGEYEAVQTHDNTAQKTKDAQQYSPTRMENTFTFDVKHTPPVGQTPGRMDFVLRRVQVRANSGKAFSYDSAGDPSKQLPILVKQFKYVVGVTSSAEFLRDGRWTRFHGLDAGWDRFGQENPKHAAAVQRNKECYGDARVGRMVARGRGFLPTDGAIEVGRTWKAKRTVPGIAHKLTEAEFTCKIVKSDAERATIAVSWHVNGMKPEFKDGKMTMFGADIKGSAEYTFHTASGMLVGMRHVVERTDQFATREGGRGTQTTTKSTETNTFVLRRKTAMATATPTATATENPPAKATPQQVAQGFLKAYRAKDCQAMGKYANRISRRLLAEMARQGASHPRWRSLFDESSHRRMAVRFWNGRIGRVGHPKPNTVWVEFNTMPKARQIVVVVLEREDGAWAVEDIHNIDSDRFDRSAGGGEPAPASKTAAPRPVPVSKPVPAALGKAAGKGEGVIKFSVEPFKSATAKGTTGRKAQHATAVAPYGYSLKNPIKVGVNEQDAKALLRLRYPGKDLSRFGGKMLQQFGSIAASKAYLARLGDGSFRRFRSIQRNGSTRGPDGHPTDIYNLTGADGKKYTLYIDIYHPDAGWKNVKAPRGMHVLN